MKVIQADVVVAGAGIAGVAAALAAARRGCRTILLEKQIWTGGLATAGNVVLYFPLCDGHGKQVMFGMAEELLLASKKYGPGEIDPRWKEDGSGKRYMVTFSPGSFVLGLSELLVNAGVELWLDSVVHDVGVVNNTLEAVHVYNKSGGHEIRGKCFVDATGDADLCFLAGAEYIEGPSKLSTWSMMADHTGLNRIYSRDQGWEEVPFMTGISGKRVTEFVLEGHKQMAERIGKDYDLSTPAGRAFQLQLPTMADVRMTRGVIGREHLDSDDAWRQFEDSIGLFPASGNLRDRSQVWSMPYRSLVPIKLRGVLTAGRCIDSRNAAWHHTRLIPMVAQSGEAAGIAAAICADRNCSPEDISATDVQDALKCLGIPCRFSEIYGAEWHEVAREYMQQTSASQNKNAIAH